MLNQRNLNYPFVYSSMYGIVLGLINKDTIDIGIVFNKHHICSI